MTLTHVPVTSFSDDDAIAAESTLIIHRPRRRRWWPALVVAAVVVALGAVALGQVTSPALRFDGTPVVWRTAPGDVTSMRSVDNALGSEVKVGFERAGTFSAELALVNHGRYPLKIVGFPEKGAYYYGLESVEMASDAEGPRDPFRSFTLRRGASRVLVLHFRFADCDLQHGQLGPAARTSLPIDYRVFGLHQRQAVPFPRFALSVPGGRCDRPVL
jgi:hypothetical protein